MGDKTYVIFNGNTIEKSSFLVPLSNRALQYGDSIFETIRVINGLPCFLSKHINRLKNGLSLLKIEVPITQIEDSVFQLIEKNNITKGAKIKITVFRNDGGKYTPKTNEGSYVISFEPSVNYYQLNNKGWKTDFFEEHRKYHTAFSSFKSSQSFVYISSGLYCKENELDHAIILNNHGRVCEGTSSNIFALKNNTLFTPPASEACIDGVMSKIVSIIAKKEDLEIIQQPIEKVFLLECDEIFFTNIGYGIRWVGALHGKRYINNVSKKLIDVLNKQIADKS